MSERGPAATTVEVVINNYNYAKFLEEAIESARAQSHRETRVIVVDDGSTDGSRELLKRYSDQVEVVLKENGGQASALNAGIERCAGDIVIFLDADDVLLPDAASRAAAAFTADPGLAKAQFPMEVIDGAGRSTGEIKPADHLSMPSGDLRASELAHPYDLVWMSTSANAFRTGLLRRIFPIPEAEFRLCADWYLVHLSALLGRVLSLPEPNSAYRMHGSNNYEPQTAALDLDHIRATIGFASATSRELLALADELGIERPARILSLADLANRMTSLRLDPGRHPIRTDSVTGLVRDAVVAARRRDNASLAMKAIFLAWFAAMALSPRGLARRLAVIFMFPSQRRVLNRLLGRLQGAGKAAQPVA